MTPCTQSSDLRYKLCPLLVVEDVANSLGLSVFNSITQKKVFPLNSLYHFITQQKKVS